MKYDSLLKQILEILGIKEEEVTKYINDLNGATQVNTILALFEQLPKDKQKLAIDHLSKFGISDPLLEKELYSFFPESKIQEILKNVYGNTINEFIEEVFPKITEDKRTKIRNLLEKY